MGYVIAAYVVALGALLLYWSALLRERRTLHNRLLPGGTEKRR